MPGPTRRCVSGYRRGHRLHIADDHVNAAELHADRYFNGNVHSVLLLCERRDEGQLHRQVRMAYVVQLLPRTPPHRCCLLDSASASSSPALALSVFSLRSCSPFCGLHHYRVVSFGGRHLHRLCSRILLHNKLGEPRGRNHNGGVHPFYCAVDDVVEPVRKLR